MAGAGIYAAYKAFAQRKQDDAYEETIASTPDDLDVADANRVLQINVLLQSCAQALGGTSALLLLWEPTAKGGCATVLAEWSGTLPPSANKYQKTELGPAYVEDVIRPLRRDRWRVLVQEDLVRGSNLSDLYDMQGTEISWEHLVLEGHDESIIYSSIRFSSPPIIDAPIMREAMRSLSVNICKVLT